MNSNMTRRDALLSAAGGTIALSAPSVLAQAPVNLTFTVWAGDVEQRAYNDLISRYQAANPRVTIRLEAVPFRQFYQQLDTRLAGRQAPDIFRVQYQQVARYAASGAAVDLASFLPADYGAAFSPVHWTAATYNGRPFAFPHHTDTFAMFYNADYLERIGVRPPADINESWTWEELIRVARLMQQRGVCQTPLAMAYVGLAYRWMIFLHQRGGQLLDDELRTPTITAVPGVETVAWTQSWFREGLAPANTSIKSTEPTQNLFANGTVGLLLNGNWQIPFIQEQMTRYRWGVTYMPRSANMASDIGGTCVAVSRDSRNREIAVDFGRFVVEEGNMRDFAAAALFLPVRRSLHADDVPFVSHRTQMKVFIEQMATVPPQLVRTVTLPSWNRMNQRMVDELELAFTSGQSADATVRNIERHVTQILAS
jgi:multiple sugar transport system substrate-binding protein